MTDFNLPSFVTWKKVFNVEKLTSNKRLVILVSLVIFSSLVLVCTSLIKVNSLYNEKKRHELELTLLRSSEKDAKRLAELDRENLRKLSNRVNNIITSGNQYDDYAVLGTSSGSQSQNYSTEPVKESIKGTPLQNVSQEKTTPNSKGKIEIYDPVKKSIDIYKDPTTISKIIGQKSNGDVADFYQKNSGWYRIQIDQDEGWINERNVRLIGE